MAPPSGPTTPLPGSPACKPFRFRLLPVEIRLMIYDLVFISPNPIRIDDPRLRHRRGASPDPVASLHPTATTATTTPPTATSAGPTTPSRAGPWRCSCSARPPRPRSATSSTPKTHLKSPPSTTAPGSAPSGGPDPAPAIPHSPDSIFSSFAHRCPDAAASLERTRLAEKLINTAEVAVLVEVEVRVAWTQRFATWLERGRPDQPKPKLPCYPDIVMSSAKRHAVWKRKMESKERRRVESERL